MDAGPELPETDETGAVHDNTGAYASAGGGHMAENVGCFVLFARILVLWFSELRLVDALNRRKVREDVEKGGP